MKKDNFFVSFFNKMKPSLIAIAIGLILGFIVMLLFNPSEAFPGLITMIGGGITIGMKGIGDILLKSTILILTGLALVVAFKTGLFNIGAPGQMVIGGYVAVHIGILWNLPAPFHWMVAMFLGMLAGAFWGLIPGVLKAFTNTNEVVSSIMLNYTAAYLVVLLVRTNSRIYNSSFAKSYDIKSTAELPGFGNLFQNSQVNIGFIIAIVAVVIIYILFNKTTIGYELKASGFNKNAANYAGMNSKRNIILAMAISGLLAGLAGSIKYLVRGSNLDTAINLLPEGFDGISVALLGLNEPIGAMFSGIFLGWIRQGGLYMQANDFPPQIIDIITSVIIYTTSIAAGIQLYLKHLKDKRIAKKHAQEIDIVGDNNANSN